jgi:hypothetical protein
LGRFAVLLGRFHCYCRLQMYPVVPYVCFDWGWFANNFMMKQLNI